jgi:hypothetical protein
MPLELQIGEQLGIMYGHELLDCLYFDHELVFDHDVHAVAAFQLHGFVDDR